MNKISITLLIILFLSSISTRNTFSDETNKSPVFPYLSAKFLDKKEVMEEPSGIAYHPIRKTLFVVSDDGMIYETDLGGKILAQRRLPATVTDEYDPEGITVNTRNGILYVASEEMDSFLEVNPETLQIDMIYEIENKDKNGKEIFTKGGNGFEGIVFVPGEKPENDRIFICNQDDPPIVISVAVPPRAKGNVVEKKTLPVLSYFTMPVKDLSAIAYNHQRKTLFILNDFNNLIFEVTGEGKILNHWSIPGQDQEGICFVDDYLFIAQDSGKILKIKVDKNKLGNW